MKNKRKFLINRINDELGKLNKNQQTQIIDSFLKKYDVSDKFKRQLKNIFGIKDKKNNFKQDLDKKQQPIDFAKEYYDDLPSNDAYKFNPTELDKTVIFNTKGDEKSKKPIKDFLETLERVAKRNLVRETEGKESNDAYKFNSTELDKTVIFNVKGDEKLTNPINKDLLEKIKKIVKHNPGIGYEIVETNKKVKDAFIKPKGRHLTLRYGKNKKIYTPMPTIKEENEELYNSTNSSLKNSVAKDRKEEKNINTIK